MMNRFVLVALLAWVGCFTTMAVSAPQGWKASAFSERGGLVYRAAEGDDAPSVLVLSAEDIAKMSSRPVAEIIAEFDSDPEEALEFALSVMWVDIDEAEPITMTSNGEPLLVGEGVTEFGARRFAISAEGEGADRAVITLIATDEDFESLGGAAFLDEPWMDTEASEQATPAPKKDPTPSADKTPAKPGKYVAPSSYQDMAAWTQDGEFWRRLVPGDPASPRHLTGTMTGDAAASHDAALKDFVEDARVKITGSTNLEPLEAWANHDGKDVRILLTETRFAEGEGVLFLLLSRGKGNAHISAFAVEMAAETYRDWSAVARILVSRGIIQSVDVYPPERIAQIVDAPLREQMALYEATLEKLYRALVIGLMQTQTQTLMMMQELNYDLLFGNDLGTPGLLD